MIDFIPRGANVAVIGGGGKTSLIRLLERELHGAGRPALVSLTTRLGREELSHLDLVEANTLAEALAVLGRPQAGGRILLAGPFGPDNLTSNTFSGLPLEWFPPLRQAAGPELTLLVEADGSAGRPLKGHRAYEPALPPLDNLVVAVVGLSVLVRPWAEAIHRPEAVTPWVDLPSREQPLTPAQVATFIRGGWAALSPRLIFLNQTDALETAEARALGRELASRLASPDWRVASGSLRGHEYAFESQTL
jgi:probable selenium-dependent hydroxylase accessory protein YqeC